jgi:hypothetical protein
MEKHPQSPQDPPQYPQDPPQNPQPPRKKLTKFQASMRWKKIEFIREAHDYVNFDLPTYLPKSIRTQIQKRVDGILEWAKKRI